TYSEAAGLVRAPEAFDECKRFAWDDEPDQLGPDLSGFLGPLGTEAAPRSEAEARARNAIGAAITTRLRRSFTPEDILQDVIGRRTDAVAAQEPTLRFQVRRVLAEADPEAGTEAEE